VIALDGLIPAIVTPQLDLIAHHLVEVFA